MNKVLIPTVLLSIVMIAGAFAFMPVNDASTVHETSILPALAGATEIRVTEFLDISGTGLSGEIVFNRISGEGVWQIEKLYLCDYEIPDASFWVLFSTETDTIGGNFDQSKVNGRNYSGGGVLVNNQGHILHSTYSGSGVGSFDTGAPDFDGSCVDIKNPTTRGNTGTGAISTIRLAGDLENNIELHFMHLFGTGSGDADGATLVAYIVGLTDASQMLITQDLLP